MDVEHSGVRSRDLPGQRLGRQLEHSEQLSVLRDHHLYAQPRGLRLDDLVPEYNHTAGAGHDDLDITIRFADGSNATLSYVTSGNSRFAKETFDAAAGGRSARLDNFRRATVWSGRRRRVKRAGMQIDKGQRGELRSFIDALRSGRPSPISIESLAATTRATLAVERSLDTGQPERL